MNGAEAVSSLRDLGLDPWERADVLAGRLAGIGFTAVVEEGGPDGPGDGRYPVVRVSSGAGLRVHGTERVFVAPDGHRVSRRLCFWWSPGEPVAPLSDLNGAVVAITRLLPCRGGSCRVCAAGDGESG